MVYAGRNALYFNLKYVRLWFCHNNQSLFAHTPLSCINLRLQRRNAHYCVCSLIHPLEFIYLCIQPHNPYEVLLDIYPSIWVYLYVHPHIICKCLPKNRSRRVPKSRGTPSDRSLDADHRPGRMPVRRRRGGRFPSLNARELSPRISPLPASVIRVL